MKKLILVMAMLFCFGIGNALAETVKVTFDVHPDPTYRTVVLVSDISGDFSAGYGQVSEPGADSVEIGNIKRGTNYYFAAYRTTPGGEKSPNSDEFPFTAPELFPEVIELPAIEAPGIVLGISISVTPTP